MIYISHRGNLMGAEAANENNPIQIQKCLDLGYYVEIDVWVKDDGLIMLGHDEGVYPVAVDFLQNEKLLCHAKNFKAAELFNITPDIHWFWHEKDQFTLTSNGWIWTYPHNRITGSIINQPEWNARWNPEEARKQYKWYKDNGTFLGVCSDYIKILRLMDEL